MFLSLAYIVFAVVFLFGLCIFVHELGHFIAAKLLGMKIETFSLGFGPSIWARKLGGVIFKIGIFPLGGYVSLPQMDPTASGPRAAVAGEGAPGEEKPPFISPWKKIVVAVAGAFGNMVLAYLVAWVVYVAGKPSTPAERSAVVGYVETNSSAYAAGMRPGDEIIAINGRAVNNWQDVIQENARFEKVEILLGTRSGTNSVALPTEKNSLGFRMIPGINAITLCKVVSVENGSGAAEAGIRGGDLIRKMDGIDILSIEHLIALVSERVDRPAAVTLERSGRELIVNVTPRPDPALNRARIGIRFDPYALDTDRVVHITPMAQLKSHTLMIVRVLRALVTPNEAKATSQALGGPLMIIFMLQDMVRKGIVMALWFICLLNVNLAILNLVPLPVLDGGHVFFALWEIVTRRPVPPKLVVILDQVFFALLIGLIILISGRDIKRLYQIRLMSKPPVEQPAVTETNTPPAAEQALE